MAQTQQESDRDPRYSGLIHSDGEGPIMMSLESTFGNLQSQFRIGNRWEQQDLKVRGFDDAA